MESALQCILGNVGPGARENTVRPMRASADTTAATEGPQPDPASPCSSQTGAEGLSLQEVVLRINRDDRVTGSSRVEVVVDVAPGIATTVVQALLAQAAAREAGFAGFVPDACLINRYVPGAKMSLHQDKDEACLAAPIVSVSLGLPAMFLFGGFERSDKCQRVPFHRPVQLLH